MTMLCISSNHPHRRITAGWIPQGLHICRLWMRPPSEVNQKDGTSGQYQHCNQNLTKNEIYNVINWRKIIAHCFLHAAIEKHLPRWGVRERVALRAKKQSRDQALISVSMCFQWWLTGQLTTGRLADWPTDDWLTDCPNDFRPADWLTDRPPTEGPPVDWSTDRLTAGRLTDQQNARRPADWSTDRRPTDQLPHCAYLWKQKSLPIDHVSVTGGQTEKRHTNP